MLCVVLFAQYLPLHTVYATSNEGIATLNLDDEDFGSNNVSVTTSLYNGSKGREVIGSSYGLYLDYTLQQEGTCVINDFSSSNYFDHRIAFTSKDNTPLVSKGKNLSIDISKYMIYLLYFEGTSVIHGILNHNSVYEISCFLRDYSGTYHHVNSKDFTFSAYGASGASGHNISASFENIPCDAYSIMLSIKFNYGSGFANHLDGAPTSLPYSGGLNFKAGFNESVINISETDYDETDGLLANIIQIVTNIKNGITELPNKIATSVKGFFDNVVNSVVNLGTTILDGIKNLFVPTEEDITDMQDKWDILLSDRFGALYQTSQLISDYANAFTEQEKNTITMPSVTIPLAGSEFVFGGWEVQVVPDGFTIVFDTLKLIISVICTIWFVNGLKNRFDRLVGGSDNI